MSSFFVIHACLVFLLISACRLRISYPRLMPQREIYKIRLRYRLFHLASLVWLSFALFCLNAPLDHLVLNYSHRTLHFCFHRSFFKGLRTFQKTIFMFILRVLEKSLEDNILEQ